MAVGSPALLLFYSIIIFKEIASPGIYDAWVYRTLLERETESPVFMAAVFQPQGDFCRSRLTRGTGGYWLQRGDKLSTSAAFLQQASREQLAAWEPLVCRWNSCGKEKNVLSGSWAF